MLGWENIPYICWRVVSLFSFTFVTNFRTVFTVESLQTIRMTSYIVRVEWLADLEISLNSVHVAAIITGFQNYIIYTYSMLS